jgi:hypothetical protein
MKNSVKLAFCSLFFLSVISCQKSNLNDTQHQTIPRGLTDSSIRAFLTSATWKYHEYFTSYNTTPTSLVWKEGKSGSPLNLALNRVTFNADGTYAEIDQSGSTVTGTWAIINSSTQIRVSNYLGNFTSTIKVLNNEEYQWLDNGGNTYGFMIPQNQVSDTTGGRLSLLTAHIWVYDEYFNQYDSSATSLVYKTNKSNSPLNLSLNQAKFNTDGTYWEIDQSGNFITGTWSFLNGQTQLQVFNYLGTFTSNIRRLDSKRLEWQDLAGSIYGEEVAQ